MVEEYENSDLCWDITEQRPDAIYLNIGSLKKYTPGFCREFCSILVRNFKAILRIPFTSYVKVGCIIFSALIGVLLFGQLDNDFQSIQTRNGALFYGFSTFIFYSCQQIMLIFPDENLVFIREYRGGLYSHNAYFAARMVWELPMILIFMFIFWSIFYFGIELNMATSEKPVIFFTYGALLWWTANGQGLLMSYLVPNKTAVMGLFPLIISPQVALVSIHYNI